jgi:hypothetical protein
MPTLLELSSTFRSHFLPTFLQAPQSPSATLPAPEDSAGISYSPERHDTIAAFEVHVEFKEFKRQFKRQLASLIAFAKRHHGNAEMVTHAFDQLADRLFNPQNDFYDKQTAVLFGAGKRSLDQFSGLINNGALPLAQRLAQVMQLAEGVQLCAEGAATSLALAANDLRLLQGGDEIYRQKQQVAQQLILEYFRKSIFKNGQRNYYVGMEIHYFNALKNPLARALGLTVQEDRTATLDDVTPHHLDECLQYVLTHMTPARLAIQCADECLSEVTCAMQRNFSESPTGDTAASFDYAIFSDALEAALTPLMEKYGKLEAGDFASPHEDSYERMQLNNDATLLALKILESLREKRLLADDYLPTTPLTHYQDDVKIGIEHYDGQLICATENGQAVLLRASHLRNVSPFDLKDVMALAIRTAITNSSPEQLLDLQWGWLSVADPMQLISKTSGTSCSPLLLKHRDNIGKLPLAARQSYATTIATCGNPAEFTAYMADHADLFASSRRATEILLAFWPIAGERKDIAMLDALTNVAMDALMPGATLPEDFIEATKKALGGFLQSTDKKHQEFFAASTRNLGYFAIRMRQHELLGADDLQDLLAAESQQLQPGLWLAMTNGNRHQVSAFGDVLLLAAAKGVLIPEQINQLLSGTYLDSALFSALENKQAATVIAYGKTILTAYKMDFLNTAQVHALLSCPGIQGFQLRGRLLSAYKSTDDDTRCAFGELLLAAYVISQNKNPGTSLLLSVPRRPNADYVREFAHKSRAMARLSMLNRKISAAHAAAKSETLSGSQLEDEMHLIQTRVHKYCVDLFVSPEDPASEKKKIARLYAKVVPEWHALKRTFLNILASK